MKHPFDQKIAAHVVFGVNTVGNVQALSLCLLSVLQGEVLPAKIQIRCEGDLPVSNNFYLAQLSDLARLKGVEVSITRALSQGVRFARDWQISNASIETPYLWMGDDDAVYDYRCLKNLIKAHELDSKAEKNSAIFVSGTKVDVNNRRGYVNFELNKRPIDELKDNCSFNHYYGIDEIDARYVKSYTADTGNLLIHTHLVQSHGIRFSLFEDSTNCGGEDTLFALECWHNKRRGIYAPAAVAFHLEKEKINFSEFAARAEMLLRVSEQRGYSKELVDKMKAACMPWEFKQQ